MERYRIDVEGSPASTETYWIYDNAQRRPVCRCERFTDADRIAALLNADAARRNGDDLPAPWPEVPKEMDLWSWRGPEYAYGGPDHDETRRTLNALIACVDDVQRRLGKEEK